MSQRRYLTLAGGISATPTPCPSCGKHVAFGPQSHVGRTGGYECRSR